MTNPKHPIPQTSSPYGIRWAVKQAVANAQLEGFEPDADFYVRLEQWLAGEISHEEYFEQVKRSASEYAARAVFGGAGGIRNG